MSRAFKANPDHPAVDYLIRLHADLGGQIDANRKEMKRLTESMRHVEAVIKLFDPGYNLRTIAARRRKRVNAWFKQGTLYRAVLDVLKAATEPLAPKAIAERMLQARGIAQPDPDDVRALDSGVRAALKQTLAKHVIADGTTVPARWRLIGDK
jgi:hypothetical protein